MNALLLCYFSFDEYFNMSEFFGPAFEPGLSYEGILYRLESSQGIDVPNFSGPATPKLDRLLGGVTRTEDLPTLDSLLNGGISTTSDVEQFSYDPSAIRKVEFGADVVLRALRSTTDILSTTDYSFNVDFIREARNEISITTAEFLDKLDYERTVNVDEIADRVGQTATYENIFRAAVTGGVSAVRAARALLPRGQSFNTAIGKITTDRVSLSETLTALVPYSNENVQVSTEETLYSLGLNLTYRPSESGLSFDFNTGARQVDLLDAIGSATASQFNPRDYIGDRGADIDIDFKDIVNLSANKPTLDAFLNGMRDAAGNIQEVATRADILKMAAPGQVRVRKLFNGVLRPGNSVNESKFIREVGNKKVDISQYGTSLLGNKYEKVDVIKTAKAIGIEDGEFYKFSDFEKVMTDEPITQRAFLETLQSYVGADFNLKNNLEEEAQYRPIQLADIVGLSDDLPTLEGLLDGLRDENGNLPEIANREAIFRNASGDSQATLRQLFSTVLPRNNGVNESAILNRVGNIDVNVGEFGIDLLSGRQEDVRVASAVEELGISTKGLFDGPPILTSIDSGGLARLNEVTSRYSIATREATLPLGTFQTRDGRGERLFVSAEGAIVLDGDAALSQIGVFESNATVYVNTGGYNQDNYLNIPNSDNLLEFGKSRVNVTEVNVAASNTNIVFQAQDPLTQGGGHYYVAGEVARIQSNLLGGISSITIEGDPSQFRFSQIDNNAIGIYYERDSNLRVTTSASTSVGLEGGGGNLSLGQSVNVTSDRPNVDYILIGTIEGQDSYSLVRGRNSVIRFGTNIPEPF